MKDKELKQHPIGQTLPPLLPEEYEALKEDIRDHDQLDPIEIYGGMVLDGWNRYNACKDLGINANTKQFSGTYQEAVGFVLSKNVHRRHLTQSRRALLAAELERLFAEDPNKPKGRPQVGQPQGTKSEQHDVANLPPGEKSRDKAAKLVGVSPRNVQKAKKILGDPDLAAKVRMGDTTIDAAYKEVASTEPAEPSKDPECKTLKQWNNLSDKSKERILDYGKGEREFNKQTNKQIEWAQWSWNPITGCEHGCDYCYARDIANRFYAYGFEPTIYPTRFSMPTNTKVPAKAKDHIGYKNVFLCSMADMFGSWVPEEWITKVLEIVEENQQWNFLALTKNPKRITQFTIPDNCWIGATVDKQARVKPAEDAFKKVEAKVKWISCEPFLEPLKFTQLELFSWIVVGGRSRNQNLPAAHPTFDILLDLYQQARAAKCMLYYKDNLYGTETRITEYPR